MKCKHEFEIEKIEDVSGIDFHKTNDGSFSKRWKSMRCKKCGHLQSVPIL